VLQARLAAPPRTRTLPRHPLAPAARARGGVDDVRSLVRGAVGAAAALEDHNAPGPRTAARPAAPAPGVAHAAVRGGPARRRAQAPRQPRALVPGGARHRSA